jgi:hypothetical protein
VLLYLDLITGVSKVDDFQLNSDYFDFLTENIGKLLSIEFEHGIGIFRTLQGDVARWPITRVVELHYIDQSFYIMPCQHVDASNELKFYFLLMKFIETDEINSSSIVGIFKKNRIPLKTLINAYPVAACEQKNEAWITYLDTSIEHQYVDPKNNLNNCLDNLWSIRKFFINEIRS